MDKAILFKILISLISIIGFIFLARKASFRFLFAKYDIIILILSRLIPFGLLYIILDTPVPSDVASYYYPQATQVLNGNLPYKDFISSYGFLFGYLNAGLLCLWHSPKIIILFAIGVELMTYVTWKFIIKNESKLPKQYFSFLYILNPLCIINTSIVGQNQILIAFFLAFFFLMRKHSFLSGVLYVFSAILIKFLALLFFPPFLFVTRHKLKFILGMVFLIAGYLLLGYILKVDIHQPFKLEKEGITSGNLMYFLFGILSFLFKYNYKDNLILMDICFYIVMIFILILIYTRRHISTFSYLTTSVTIIGLSLMLFSKKSYTNYMVIFWIPLIISTLCSNRPDRLIGHLIVFSSIGSLEPSIWFQIVARKTFDQVLSHLGIKEIIFILVEMTLLIYMIFFFTLFLKQLLAYKEKLYFNDNLEGQLKVQ